MLTLQKNECKVPVQQLNALAQATQVPAREAAAIIFAIRTNACEIFRGGDKVRAAGDRRAGEVMGGGGGGADGAGKRGRDAASAGAVAGRRWGARSRR